MAGLNLSSPFLYGNPDFVEVYLPYPIPVRSLVGLIREEENRYMGRMRVTARRIKERRFELLRSPH